MAILLHLETATKVCSVALSRDGEQIALKEIEEVGYSHGENLTLIIQELIQKAGLSMKDLDAVSVASGPGSYTGLRIGAATAKGLCYALNIPLIAVDALTSLCEIARAKHPQQNLCALIDARRMEVFALIQNGDGQTIKEISADVLEEESYSEFAPFVYFGDGAAKLSELWANRNLEADFTIKSSASGQIRLAFEKFQNKSFEDVAYWEPFYLKDFVVQATKRSK
ncbi:MAG: tRNA (adenosine(37)-N6)-threonylcarbamoyltransferase complex dimerization subunit type 1 TsaB [Fluviicola sp. XM-24bin1]|nr:MAG: tRNA (adenosine(37)-N6)-threonylcarbamoyltransferase complex dimerization subunit type 1 TsaB [Fluviicola sp. XM-24bin1]